MFAVGINKIERFFVFSFFIFVWWSSNVVVIGVVYCLSV